MLENHLSPSSDILSHAIRQLIDAISRAPEGPQGLEIIYKEALLSLKDSLDIERASILLFDPDGVMRFKAWLGISDNYRKAVEGHTPWGQDAINPTPIILPDLFRDEELRPHFPVFASEDIRALAFIPLLYRSRIIGKFMLYSRVPYDFSNEIEPACTIAQLVAYAVIRKKIEEQLNTSQLRLKTILENEPECVNIINSEGIILEMNPAGLAMLETDTVEDVIGKSIYPMISKDFHKPFQDLITQVCGGEKKSLEFHLKTFKQTNRILETHAVPFFSDEHNKTVLLAVTRDITEKKRAEVERERLLIKEKEARLGAEKSVQLRDDFLSIASHELKTPLTPIRMNMQLLNRYLNSLASEFPKAGILLKVFESTDEQFARFLKLVENLLDVSRITAERLILTKENFNMSQLLNEIILRYKPEYQNLGYMVNLNTEENIMGFWDRVRIEQVITNIITNAIKYGMGNPIDISLTLKKNQENQKIVKLVVTDHGIGIAREDQEKIFNRFERVASLKSYGGLGLGLFISKTIITSHGGTIKVESELNSGSSFIIELPIVLN